MLRCWETKPEERPSFSSLKKIMKEMERKHEVGSLILVAKYVLVIIWLLVVSPDALGVSNHNCSNLKKMCAIVPSRPCGCFDTFNTITTWYVSITARSSVFLMKVDITARS